MTTVKDLKDKLSKLPENLPIYIEEANGKTWFKKISAEGVHNLDLDKVTYAIIRINEE